MDAFGGHTLAIPFRSIAESLALFRARDPRRTAITDIDQKTSITFEQLDLITGTISADLRRRGVQRGDAVVLLANEVLEKLLLWLGVWRIGATVCPITVELNEAHLTFIANLVKPKLLLIHDELGAGIFAGSASPVISFGRWQPNAQDCGTYFRSLPHATDSYGDRNAPEDIAGMVCTSGTTDRPKIVVYDHGCYWLQGLDTIDMLGLTDHDRTLEYRSFGWNSAQILSLLPFLQLGLTLHIARRFSNSRFFDWIRDYRISFAAGVPAVLNMLLNRPSGDRPDTPSLRLMSCSSAPLAPEQWAQFENRYGITLLQLYGMSEAGWICGNTHYKRRKGTVGPPAIHQEFAIVDPNGHPCPANVEGEVTVGGPQTSIGLLQDDGVIAPVRGRRFKSGDLAIMDDDGFVRITGRTKDLIIRGGINVSPVEVDAVLLAHPALSDAAALGVPDPVYGEEVIACAVLRPGAWEDEAAILNYCAGHLPPAKRPKRILFLPELPKSDRGKVLRDRLREEFLQREQLSQVRS
ncbi:MAG TPA: class I adenylate-forming enzyme family protein [Micropepsaceae bacterium]|nr:class I adenylate-forming enzyme family protein [Micropepsaceae bacterium]